ncbi:hypothetical protein LTR84_002567 [Exophiala bonariae]|uniref:Tachykinin family protein n=1 Tax=Exophiala bonariae TaxID=1690606 RepID=A0AAV9NDJ5_9EURO|nr:hypothetical protein LTR84_002567 [Exophiala bonariae]
MPATSGKSFLFIDSNPNDVDQREQELRQSKARSHAASASHRLRSNLLRAERARQKTSTSSTPASLQSLAPNTTVTSESLKGLDRTPLETPASVQEIAVFSRWRLRGAPKRREPTGKKAPVREHPTGNDTREIGHLGLLPLPLPYKGNCDPFSSAGIPVTAHQYSLIKLSRSESVATIWASELSMRSRNGELMDDLCQSLGTLCNDPAVVHANLALGYITKAACQGKFEANDFLAIKRQKSQALRSLRELVDKQCESGSQDKLLAIKDATQLIGACEIFLGDSNTAVIHATATARVIGLMGGFQSLSAHEVELFVHSVIGLATKLNARPIVSPETWDPGPWHSYKSKGTTRKQQQWTQNAASPSSTGSSPQSSWSVDNAGYATLYGYTPASPGDSSARQSARPTTVCPQLSNILEEMRELLAVEEIKIRSTPFASDDAVARESLVHMFRWSHLRTTAIRGRGINHWCDLLLEANLAASQTQTHTHTQDPASPESAVVPSPSSFDICLCWAMRLLDRCILHEPYLKTNIFRQTQAYYQMLLSSVETLRPEYDVRRGPYDSRSYDMLWVYSVGAHTEIAFLQGKGQPSVNPQQYFKGRFGRLAISLGFTDFWQIARFLEENYLYCPRYQDLTLRNLVDFDSLA